MGMKWSKNGRPVKQPRNPIESGSVVLVDKIADKLLNQKNVTTLENIFGKKDYTSPVVVAKPRQSENEVQRVVIDTINKKVPADLKVIQDQGSQELITPLVDHQANDMLSDSVPSPTKSHLQLNISKMDNADLDEDEPTKPPTFKFSCQITNPENTSPMIPHPIVHQTA